MTSTSSPRSTGAGTGLARALAADLRDLTVDLAAGSYTRTTLAMLERDLRRSLSSSLGCTVRLFGGACAEVPIEVHLVPRTVEPEEVAAALEISLGSLVPGIHGSIVFYAGAADAFVHLAADLTDALGLGAADLNWHPPRPDVALTATIAGLQDFSLVNRAIGVLINRGHSVDGARAELRRRADRAHTDLIGAAQALLSSAYY